MTKERIYKGVRICIALLLLYAVFARDYFFLAVSAWLMVDFHFGELKCKLKKTGTHNLIPTITGGDPLDSDIHFWGGKPPTIKVGVINTDEGN